MSAADPTRAPIEAVYPLTPMQRGMLFHALYDASNDDYVEQICARIDGPLEVGAFRAAWSDLLARHAILRTSFHVLDRSEPAQVVHGLAHLPWVEHDWSGLDADAQAAALDQLLDADRRTGFAPDQAPLLRCTLIRLGPDAHQLVWTHHHLLLDGWSVPIVLADLAELYRARRGGRAGQLPEPPQFRTYLDWLQRQDLAGAERFWRHRLAGMAPTPLPGPAVAPAPGPPVAPVTYSLTLPADTTTALADFARSAGLTLATLVQAAWGLVLARYAGTDDVVFGVTVAGRPADLPDVSEIAGLFINTLPMRIRVAGAVPVQRWLGEVQADFAAQRRFEYVSLTDIHGWTDVPRGASLFDSIVVHENQPLADAGSGQFEGIRFTELRSAPRTNYPLTLISLPGARHRLQLLADPVRVPAPLGQDLLAAVQTLLTQLAAGPAGPVRALAVTASAGQHELARVGSGVIRDYARQACLAAEFLAQVERTPDAVALIEQDRQLSYRRLRTDMFRVAGGLRSAGISAGDRVGVIAGRSGAFVAAVLGVLACGATYVPLDPAYPEARLRYMAEDAGLRAVLAGADGHGASLADRLSRSCSLPALRLDDLLAGTPAEPCGRPHGGSAVAYEMYTSGSTGRPKGVAVPHRAILRLVRNTDFVRIGPDDRMAFLSNTAFDAATFEIWGALLSGGCLVVVSRDELLSPPAFAQLLSRHAVTVGFLTSALFSQLALADPGMFGPLRTLCVGGEALDAAAVNAVLRSPQPPLRLVNAYGPTETTTFACWQLIEQPAASEQANIPIGRAIANSSAYVVDDAGWLTPPDAVGELFLGGDGLGHGYLGRPALTAERFVPDPFGGRRGGRLYRTGDRARLERDGAISCLGRTDHQVKLRGHRIELGEIETALRAEPGVDEAVVLLRRDPETGPRLVAYVSTRAGEQEPAALSAELLRRCAATLPPHFVPSSIMVVNRLPLNANGKLDRAALPAPDGHDEQPIAAADAPRPGFEQVMASIWAELLGVRTVAATDNFFALGGHSLLATRLSVRLRSTLNLDVPLRTIFESANLRDFASTVQALRQGQPVAVAEDPLPATHSPRAPMSFSQQRLWFLEQWEPGTALYHITGALRLVGELSVAPVQAALQRITERHDALRTSFGPDGEGGTEQRVADRIRVSVPVLDLSGLAQADTALAATVDAGMRTPFQLASAPLWRAVIVRLAPGSDRRPNNVLVLALHHLIADGRSLEILLAELAALLRGGELAPLPAQYTDYARWQQSASNAGSDADLNYWKRQLDGIAEVSTPPDHQPAAATLAAATEVVVLADDADHRLRTLAGQAGATPFMTALAVFAVALGQTRGLPEVAVGTPVANRSRPEVQDLIGFFVNTLVLRVPLDPGGSQTFLRLLQHTREICLDAYQHQELPFEQVVAQLRPQRRTDRLPLFQTWFVVHEQSTAGTVFPGLEVAPISSPDRLARYDLRLDLQRGESSLRAVFEYRADLFDASSIARLARRFRSVFDAVTADPTITLETLAARLTRAEAELRASRRGTITLSSRNRLQATRRRAVDPAAPDPNGAPS